ncbi:MAG: hypothetical protein NVSMB26_06840 [Beijerinckiaceae bacterium]
MKLKYVLAGAALLVSVPALADPTGEWRVQDGKATVRIHKCGGEALCGSIASTTGPAGKDQHNPNPALRNRSVKGIQVLNNMRPSAGGTWSGPVYNAEDGQMYSGKLSLVSEQQLKLEGCVPGGGLCGAETWTRVR